jgi:hypothetical protein
MELIVLWATAARCSIHLSVAHRCKRFFSRPLDPDLLWGPPVFLFSAYWSGGKGHRGVKLTSHLHQQLILEMSAAQLLPPRPQFLYGFHMDNFPCFTLQMALFRQIRFNEPKMLE